MNAIAPNLTCMVGELVGARLIAHAGSLLNLAKAPASTVQILGKMGEGNGWSVLCVLAIHLHSRSPLRSFIFLLLVLFGKSGAEKALFRALKTKHDTPKYGLIYHASVVGQAAPKFKGKISRVRASSLVLLGCEEQNRRFNA